jgi:hypothetical protein
MGKLGSTVLFFRAPHFKTLVALKIATNATLISANIAFHIVANPSNPIVVAIVISKNLYSSPAILGKMAKLHVN